MTRIKYKLGHMGYFSQQMLALDQMVFVLLKPNETGEIINAETNVPITVFAEKDQAKLKKLIKKELIQIGVKFQPEVRPRLKKEVPVAS